MEEKTGQQGEDRVARGDRLVPDNFKEQTFAPKDVVSVNPSPSAVIAGTLSNATSQPGSLPASRTRTPVYPYNSYSPTEQTYYYGGYDNNTAVWGDYSNYVQANGLQVVPPAVYNENQSLLFHPSYSFDTQVGYGQFSPVASPLSPVVLDGQLYSPHQVPLSPSYYPQTISPSLPHVTSTLPVSQTELLTPATRGQEAFGDNFYYNPGSGYYMQYGSVGGGNLSGNNNFGYFTGDLGSAEQLSNRTAFDKGGYFSPVTPGAMYPPPISIPGSYEQYGQISPQHKQFPGYGLVSSSSTRRYPQSASYRSSQYGGGSVYHGEASRFNRLSTEKGGKQDKERSSISIANDSQATLGDRNRGPRALKPKSNNTEENSSPKGGKDGECASGVRPDVYNQPNFVTNYEKAKFFVIKSFSEDNVHKSIKYNVWSSTPLGNRKLDAAYREAKESGDPCPVFLFFSVNASGQFCGVAEMVGPVDFENDADYWQQERWSGQFLVQWHIIKDVPNSRLRHILLENNENKPVTHSRDSQEVKLEEGLEMLKLFKDYEAESSILDDFCYYNEREKDLQVKRSSDRHIKNVSDVVDDDVSITQLSGKMVESLQLNETKELPGKISESLQLNETKELAKEIQ